MKDRTKLRQTMLDNGWLPLPLADGTKACYIPGWSHVTIDDKFLKEHARKAAWSLTGCRTGNILVIDIDIDDEELGGDVEEICYEQLGDTTFLRWGKGHKRALVYWIDEPIKKRMTGKYRGHRVEVLSRGSQFACFGRHPSGVEYEWQGASPLTDTVDELPTVVEHQIDAFVESVNSFFTDKGFELDATAGTIGESDYDYCLTDNMQFEVTTPALGMLKVSEIKSQLAPGDTWECNLTAIRPTSDSQAGRIHYGESGQLSIADFVTMTTYFESLDLTPEGNITLPPKPQFTLFGSSAMDRYEWLLKTHIYVQDGTIRKVADPTRAFRKDNYKLPGTVRLLDDKRARPIVSRWLDDDRAMRADYCQLLPHTTAHLVPDGDATILNTYRPPLHEDRSGETNTFDEFMRHLIPADKERDLLLDWIANKLQNPTHRMHAMVIATREFGTGRGTLAEIMSVLIGEPYCTETSLSHLTGTTGQAQYNDYLSGSLLVNIPEAYEAHDKGRWHARRQAYEQIKQVIETGARRLLIRRKGVANVSEKVYASILIATNHYDAFAIEPGDRRMIVLDGTRNRLNDTPLADWLHEWHQVPGNIGALYDELIQRDVKYKPFGDPPNTQAKARMIEHGQSGMDTAYQAFIDRMDGDLVTEQQWKQHARILRHELELEFPDEYKVDGALRRVLHDHAQRIHDDRPTYQVRVDSAVIRPWIIRNFERWKSCADREAIRAEILKNGPVDDSVVAFPTKPKR